jgi:hypothetical protein
MATTAMPGRSGRTQEMREYEHRYDEKRMMMCVCEHIYHPTRCATGSYSKVIEKRAKYRKRLVHARLALRRPNADADTRTAAGLGFIGTNLLV